MGKFDSYSAITELKNTSLILTSDNGGGSEYITAPNAIANNVNSKYFYIDTSYTAAQAAFNRYNDLEDALAAATENTIFVFMEDSTTFTIATSGALAIPAGCKFVAGVPISTGITVSIQNNVTSDGFIEIDTLILWDIDASAISTVDLSIKDSIFFLHLDSSDTNHIETLTLDCMGRNVISVGDTLNSLAPETQYIALADITVRSGNTELLQVMADQVNLSIEEGQVESWGIGSTHVYFLIEEAGRFVDNEQGYGTLITSHADGTPPASKDSFITIENEGDLKLLVGVNSQDSGSWPNSTLNYSQIVGPDGGGTSSYNKGRFDVQMANTNFTTTNFTAIGTSGNPLTPYKIQLYKEAKVKIDNNFSTNIYQYTQYYTDFQAMDANHISVKPQIELVGDLTSPITLDFGAIAFGTLGSKYLIGTRGSTYFTASIRVGRVYIDDSAADGDIRSAYMINPISGSIRFVDMYIDVWETGSNDFTSYSGNTEDSNFDISYIQVENCALDSKLVLNGLRCHYKGHGTSDGDIQMDRSAVSKTDNVLEYFIQTNSALTGSRLYITVDDDSCKLVNNHAYNITLSAGTNDIIGIGNQVTNTLTDSGTNIFNAAANIF